MFRKSLANSLFAAALLGASAMAQAAIVELDFAGADSGYTNSWEVQIYGGQVTSGQLELYIEFEKLWYDPMIGEITGNDYFEIEDCTIGSCDKNYLKSFTYDATNNILHFTQTTPLSTNDCVVGLNPLFDCAYTYQTPELNLIFQTEGEGVEYEVRMLRTSSAIPEPATWAMLIAGFGLVGGAMRHRKDGTKKAMAA